MLPPSFVKILRPVSSVVAVIDTARAAVSALTGQDNRPKMKEIAVRPGDSANWRRFRIFTSSAKGNYYSGLQIGPARAHTCADDWANRPFQAIGDSQNATIIGRAIGPGNLSEGRRTTEVIRVSY